MNENTINERKKTDMAQVSRCQKNYNTLALLHKAMISYCKHIFLFHFNFVNRGYDEVQLIVESEMTYVK